MSRGTEGRRLRTDNEPVGLRAMARAVRCTHATRYRAAQSLSQQPQAGLPGSAEAGRIPPENQAGNLERRNGFQRIIAELIELGGPHEDVIVTRHERRTSVASALPCHVPASGRAAALTGASVAAHSS